MPSAIRSDMSHTQKPSLRRVSAVQTIRKGRPNDAFGRPFPSAPITHWQLIDCQHITRMPPFTVQKAAFCVPIDGLLESERPPFRVHPQTCWMAGKGHSVYVLLQVWLSVMCFGGFAIINRPCISSKRVADEPYPSHERAARRNVLYGYFGEL